MKHETIRILNRMSFRVTDNALYEKSLFNTKPSQIRRVVHVYLILPKAPETDEHPNTLSYSVRGASRSMGVMQLAFLLQVVRGHCVNLSETWKSRKQGSPMYKFDTLQIHIRKGDIPRNEVRKWIREENSVWSDMVPDPRVPRYESRIGSPHLHRVSTSELIDWTIHGSTAHQFLIQFCKGRLEKSRYAHTDPLKQFVVDQLLKDKTMVSNASKPSQKDTWECSNPGTQESIHVKNDELQSLNVDIRNIQKLLESANRIFPKIPSKISIYELIRSAIRGAKGLCKVWKKPNTSPAARWGSSWSPSSNGSRKRGEYCCITTQLSPWLAIGAISPRTVWRFIQCSSKKSMCTSVQSLKGQLLWRESFHAIGHAALFDDKELKSLRVKSFWTHPDKFAPPWYTYSKNTKNSIGKNGVLQKWVHGRLSAKDGPPFRNDPIDTNTSMQQLIQTGWIHHLQRHLVASVLTRPYNVSHRGLGQHWLHGESTFRTYLLDHDACINRANYMWIAGVAFSSKLKSPQYAYREDDYIRRRVARCV